MWNDSKVKIPDIGKPIICVDTYTYEGRKEEFVCACFRVRLTDEEMLELDYDLNAITEEDRISVEQYPPGNLDDLPWNAWPFGIMWCYMPEVPK